MSRRFLMWRALFIFIFAMTSVFAAPQRVVSMSLCTDQLLLSLLPIERIAAVSYLSRDKTYSRFSEQAQSVAIHHADVEHILSLAPDLILASRYERSQATSMLQRLGANLLIVDAPQTVDDIAVYTMTIAQALQTQSQAQAMLDAMKVDWQRAETLIRDKPALLAMSMSANGYQQGRQTLFNELLHRAGLRSAADELGLQYDGNITIENALRLQADITLYHSDESGQSLAEQWVTHPAWSAQQKHQQKITLPTADWICAGPWTSSAVLNLIAQRK